MAVRSSCTRTAAVRRTRYVVCRLWLLRQDACDIKISIVAHPTASAVENLDQPACFYVARALGWFNAYSIFCRVTAPSWRARYLAGQADRRVGLFLLAEDVTPGPPVLPEAWHGERRHRYPCICRGVLEQKRAHASRHKGDRT